MHFFFLTVNTIYYITAEGSKAKLSVNVLQKFV